MGLLDNVLGSAVPGGRYAKPLGIALLALLASRAMGGGGFGAGGRGGADEGGGGGLVGGGGLGGLLSGGLGGIIGGLMGGGGDTRTMPNQDQAHAAVSGGLGELLQRFQQSGFGDTVNSWIGTGANRPIAPDQLNQALSPETVDECRSRPGCLGRGVIGAVASAADHGGSPHARRPHPRPARNGALARRTPNATNRSRLQCDASPLWPQRRLSSAMPGWPSRSSRPIRRHIRIGMPTGPRPATQRCRRNGRAGHRGGRRRRHARRLRRRATRCGLGGRECRWLPASSAPKATPARIAAGIPSCGSTPSPMSITSPGARITDRPSTAPLCAEPMRTAPGHSAPPRRK